MALPPLLEERSDGVEFVLVVVVPSLFGVLTGWALGANEPAYLVLSLLGIGGGFFAGVEHDRPLAGFYRGLLGGLQFGVWILVTNAALGEVPKAELPDKPIYLILITAGFGAGLGALGGRYRARRGAAATTPAP